MIKKIITAIFAIMISNTVFAITNEQIISQGAAKQKAGVELSLGRGGSVPRLAAGGDHETAGT